MKTVCFEALIDAPALAVGGMVARSGKIFECGDYPDKKFSLTEAEADRAIALFSPVPNDVSHKPTVLAGKSGYLAAIEYKGNDIYGTIMEPQWLSDQLGDAPRKVSMEWDLASKTVHRIIYTDKGRVADAAVFEPESGIVGFRFETSKERELIAPEDFGDPTNKLFPCRTQDEFRRCVEQLALADDTQAVKNRLLEIAARKGFDSDLTGIVWPAKGVSVPVSPNDEFSMFEPKEKIMETPKKGLLAALRDVLRGATDEEIASFEAIAPKPLASEPAAKSAAELALEAANAKIAAFEAATVAAATTERKARATAFADGLVAEQRIVAKGNEEYNQALVLFELADGFEAARPALACFEAGFEAKDARPVDALKALFAKLPVHGKNEEAATNVTEGTVALFEQAVTVTNEPGQEKPTPARKKQLLGLTSLGQAAEETK